MKKLFIICLLLISTVALAQKKVVACESYDENTGKPTGIYSTWDIKPTGGYVYLHYSQDAPITGELTLYVDKKNSNGEYVAFATEYFDIPKGYRKNWSVYDFNFTEKGEFKITVLKDGNELASCIQKINIVDDGSSNNNEDDDDEEDKVDTWYYEDSEITFGTNVDADNNYKVEGISDEFYLSSSKTKDVYIVVEQDKPFKTTLFYVDIYLGDDLIKTIEIDMEEDWNIAWAKHTFTKKGEYSIDVYNEEDTFVNTATVKIK